jgi:hypothetical protein
MQSIEGNEDSTGDEKDYRLPSTVVRKDLKQKNGHSVVKQAGDRHWKHL